ncbi:MAG: zf-HC2 domain-containing protein, partial [Actinomycetota bacterium]
MEFEFDKEIDAILRKARGTEVVASFDLHLGADEISAFAENALPELARARDAEHLADCTRCRKILSDVIALNSEAETVTASSVVPAKIAETKMPWYRKLFIFPQLAYAMGALVVLFSGFFGYLILQNFTGSKNSEVSYSAKKADSAEKP